MSLEKSFLVFGVGGKEQWVNGLMKLRFGTQVTIGVFLYMTLLKEIQVSKWSVSKGKSIRTYMSSVHTAVETSCFE